MSVFSDSLSFGLRDALDLGCQDEAVFLTACRIRSEDELEKTLERYTEVYWRKHPNAASAARRAYAEGRIIIPRLQGFCRPVGSQGHPLYTEWEEWRWEVSRHAPKWEIGWCPCHCQVTESQVLACDSVMDVCKLFPVRIKF